MPVTAIDEQWNVRKLQAIREIQPPLEIKPTAKVGLSPISSLSAVDVKEAPAPTLKPELASPTTHYMYDVADLYQHVEHLMARYTTQLKGQVQADLKELDRLQLQRIEKDKAYREEMETKAKWDTLSRVANYISSATSIVLGAGLAATPGGQVAGKFLIAAGALSLTTQVVTDVNGWNALAGLFTNSRETQQKYAFWCELTASSLALAISATSLICAYQAGALAMNGAEWAKKVSQALTMSSMVANSTARIGATHAKMKGDEIMADMKEEITLKEFMVRQELKSLSNEELAQNYQALQTLTEQFHQMAESSIVI
ncbi:MAG: hypothetical protein KGJ02_07085 [Verrucomicrobiota bacterium]|nr:hypothetical protein [Verrucomicrobiota bacterium]